MKIIIILIFGGLFGYNIIASIVADNYLALFGWSMTSVAMLGLLVADYQAYKLISHINKLLETHSLLKKEIDK